MGSLFGKPSEHTQNVEQHYKGIYCVYITDRFVPQSGETIKEYSIKSATTSEFMTFFVDLIGQEALRTVILRVIINYMIRCGGYMEERWLVLRTKNFTCIYNILENEGCDRAVVLEIE